MTRPKHIVTKSNRFLSITMCHKFCLLILSNHTMFLLVVFKHHYQYKVSTMSWHQDDENPQRKSRDSGYTEDEVSDK